MLNKLLKIKRELDHRRTINRIRANLEFFGVDTSGLSDQALESRLLDMCSVLAEILPRTGVTADQAAAAFRAISQALQKP